MSRGSLRWRLLAGGAAVILLVLGAAAVGLGLLFERHVVRGLVGELDVYVGQLISAIEVSEAGPPRLTRLPSDPRFDEPLSGLYWQVAVDGAPPVRSRSLWDTTLELPMNDTPSGEIGTPIIKGPLGSRLQVVERSIMMHAGERPVHVHLAVAADLARVTAARHAFTQDLVVALLGLGAILATAMAVQITLGLKPLEHLRRGLADIRAGTEHRLAVSVPQEVLPLAEEVNALIEAQQAEIERSRNRAADLAHGLKTPLAALAADVRRLREKGEMETAADIEGLGETMRRHVERELARARARGSRKAGITERLALAPAVQALAATLRRTPDGETREFRVDIGGDVMMPMSRDDLTEVLGNVMENAVRHAARVVRVSAFTGAAGIGVAVEDDGPGVPEQSMAVILERGHRLDQKGGGAGLGFAIVQDILELYGRKLTLSRSSLGGLRVEI